MWSSIVLSFESQGLRRPFHHWVRSQRFDARLLFRERPPMWRPLELAPARCSKPPLLNQAPLDRRDPRLGFTERLGACVHGVGAQDQVVIMRDSRAKYELCIDWASNSIAAF